MSLVPRFLFPIHFPDINSSPNPTGHISKPVGSSCTQRHESRQEAMPTETDRAGTGFPDPDSIPTTKVFVTGPAAFNQQRIHSIVLHHNTSRLLSGRRVLERDFLENSPAGNSVKACRCAVDKCRLMRHESRGQNLTSTDRGVCPIC